MRYTILLLLLFAGNVAAQDTIPRDTLESVEAENASDREKGKKGLGRAFAKIAPGMIITGSLLVVGDVLLVDDNWVNKRDEDKYRPTPFGYAGFGMIVAGILVWPGALLHLARSARNEDVTNRRFDIPNGVLH